MTFVLVVGFGILSVLYLIGLVDWYARKRERTSAPRDAQ